MATKTMAGRARRLTRERRTSHAVMVDKEEKPNRYYIITTDALDRGLADGYLFEDDIHEVFE